MWGCSSAASVNRACARGGLKALKPVVNGNVPPPRSVASTLHKPNLSAEVREVKQEALSKLLEPFSLLGCHEECRVGSSEENEAISYQISKLEFFKQIQRDKIKRLNRTECQDSLQLCHFKNINPFKLHNIKFSVLQSYVMVTWGCCHTLSCIDTPLLHKVQNHRKCEDRASHEGIA